MDFVDIRPGLICGRRNIFVISCSSPCKVFCKCYSFLYSLQPVHMEKFSDSELQVFILSILSGNPILDFDSKWRDSVHGCFRLLGYDVQFRPNVHVRLLRSDVHIPIYAFAVFDHRHSCQLYYIYLHASASPAVSPPCRASHAASPPRRARASHSRRARASPPRRARVSHSRRARASPSRRARASPSRCALKQPPLPSLPPAPQV